MPFRARLTMQQPMTDVTLPRTPAIPDGLPNAGTPVAGIITAGQPSAAQLAGLAAGGIEVVIDLRGASEPRGFEEPAAAKELGLEYHSVPVDGNVGPREFDAVRALLRARAGRPVLVHCKSANRVGAALIPYLMLDEHLSRDAALESASRIGLRSEELARAALAYVDAIRCS